MSRAAARSDRALIAAIFVAGLLAAGQFAKVALSLPSLGAAYGHAPVRLAHQVSIVGGVGLLFGAVAGGVAAAFGARRVLLSCLLGGALMSFIQAALPPLPVLTLTRILEGASHLGIVVAAPTLIAGAASTRGRPLAMALWATFFGFAFALAAVAVPPILARGGLPLLFALHGAGLVVVALVLAPMLPAQPRRPLRLGFWAVHPRIYRPPRRAMPGLGFVFYTLLFVALVTLVPPMLERPRLAAVLPLVGLGGTLAAGGLARRWHPAGVMAAGFAGTILCAGLFWSGMGAWVIYPLFFAMGLAPGGAFALIPHLNARPGDRALAAGGVAQMGNLGTTMGTPAFAALQTAGGDGAVWGGTLAVAAGGLATVLWMAARVGRAGPDRDQE